MQRPITLVHHRPRLPPRAMPRPFVPGRFLTPPKHHVPPPGWTPEFDRMEEFADLSYTTALSKAAPGE